MSEDKMMVTVVEIDESKYPVIKEWDSGEDVYFIDENEQIVGLGRMATSRGEITSYVPADEAAIKFFNLPKELMVVGLRFHNRAGVPMPRTEEEDAYYRDTRIVGKLTRDFEKVLS